MRENTIFRVIKDSENPYVMINKGVMMNNGLSLKAKGLMAYLLSLPDDWRIYESELVKHHTDGKASLKSGIQELIKAGYIERTQIRSSKGQFKGYEYRVYEDINRSRFSDNGFSVNGFSDTTNNDVTDTKVTYRKNKKGVNLSDCHCVRLYFELFESRFGYKHPFIKIEQIRKAEEKMALFLDDYCLDLDKLSLMILRGFDLKDIDHNINHFVSGRVMELRYYEVIYNK